MSTPAAGVPSRRDPAGSDDRLALIERLAGSVHLKRSARLRAFLLYVGKRSLEEGSGEIREQEIGAAVFGRGKDYDTSQDNIVRVNATELRKRVEAYFASEGASEPLILEIPRGGYKPLFKPRDLDKPIPQPKIPPQRPRLALALVCVLALACALLIAQNVALRSAANPLESQPALGSFWPAFFHQRQHTDIVLADASFGIVEDILNRQLTLSDYLNGAFLRVFDSAGLTTERKADLQLIVSRHYGSLGDFRVADRVIAMSRAVNGSPRLQFAREYRAEDIKQNNTVLIGSRRSNPWAELFESRLNFSLEYDPNFRRTCIRNRSPRSKEESVYTTSSDPFAFVAYSVIAFLHNPTHTADALLFAGTNAEATEAAGEFLTTEPALARFRGVLKCDRFPYFEVLLRTKRVGGSSFGSEIVAFRTYPD